MMKRIAVVVLIGMILAAGPARSADPKLLQNLKGDVSYQKASAPNPKPLAPQARVALDDSDTALTGDASLGEVLLPDSTKVTLGANTKVQLAFFNQAATTTATFIIYNGKARFDVQHPDGAPANYTFKTPTAQIAVRGTEGDIGVADNELDVNIYHLGDPDKPVEVTTTDGKSYQVLGGQSFVAQIVNGVIQASVEQLKQDAIDKFSDQFGFPPTVDGLKGAAENAVTNKVRSLLHF